MTRYGSCLLLLLSALAVTASGCGPKFTYVPVEGTVTKNGRPLANVEVVFLADPDAATEGPRATGRTDEAGHYRLRTDHGDDGAVAGTHRVLVLDLEAVRNTFLQNMAGKTSSEDARRLEDERRKTPENA